MTAITRSFKEYLKNRFYNEISKEIGIFATQNSDNLDISSYCVNHIDEIEVMDIDFKQVYTENLTGMRVGVEILTETELYISQTDRHNDRNDQKYVWFKLECSGDLSKNLDDFTISNVCLYDSRAKQTKPLSDSLVPIIHKDELEAVAKDFLEQHYPQALYEPMPVDPYILVEKMGLTVEKKHITSDCSVFGEIMFNDCETEYYDKNSESFKKINVSKGTIFVEPDSFYLRNLGSVNNTIVHECVHWDKHRKAFELERLYNESATKIKCQVVGGVKESGEKTATDWMEWQANNLTPRIQMPYTQTKVKSEEFIRRYKTLFHTRELIDVMEPVIDEIAVFFNVSRCAAKIRMIDLGYEEAIGTFTYIDGKYVKPHTFQKGSLKRNQTYSVSLKDAAIQSIIHTNLKACTEQGDFQFVDSHICINDKKYITVDDKNNLRLTDYARHHIDECCIAFDLSVNNSTNKYGKEYYTECVLYRDSNSGIIFEAKFTNSDMNKSVAERAKTVNKYLKETATVLNGLPASFGGSLVELMKWRKTTNEELAEEIRVDPKTIQRLRNNSDSQTTTVETVVSICIGLQLPPPISNNLLTKAGLVLRNTNDNHLMYSFLLDGCYTMSLDQCNELLGEQSIPLLGGKE